MEKNQLSILLIESHQNVADEIRKELSDQGFKVSTSKSTDSGMLRAQAHPFNFFIVNCGADGKQGFNFAYDVCKIEGYTKPYFIFVFNPSVKVDVRLRKFEYPFDIIRLPFDANELRIRINKLLVASSVDKKQSEPEKSQIKGSKNQDKKTAEDKSKSQVQVSSKVLLVEDNPLNQKVLGMFISRLGFEYDIASNGQMAVDLSKKENYPFILMDIYMPGMDGTEATEKIREYELSGTHRAHIIAITANESEESVKRCYDSGMDDYLVKPFTLEVLKEKLV